MNRIPQFLHWLVYAALLDWLVTRTLARAAIFMPKSPAILAGYQVVMSVGQAASVLAALLALVGMGWLAFQLWRTDKGALPWGVLVLPVLSLLFLVLPPLGWILLAYELILISVLAGLAWRELHSGAWHGGWLAFMLPFVAILAGVLYQTLQAFYSAFRLAGPPPSATALFDLGELFAVLTPIALWWCYKAGRVAFLPYGLQADQPHDGIKKSFYIVGLIPALAFGIFYFLNPAMTGILSIWSTGLTLYLPWPAYALSLWLAAATLLSARRDGNPVWLALLLLAAGGYAPQLSSQVFFGLIGLSLLSTRYSPKAAMQLSGYQPRIFQKTPGTSSLGEAETIQTEV